SLLADIDEDDGVYFIDIFDDISDFELINCTTSNEYGKIILDPYSLTTGTYNYSDWTIDSDDRAYSYSFLFPLTPKFGINYYENEFNSDDYNLIESKDNRFYPLREANEPFLLQPMRKIHHFRLKIDENNSLINKLNIYWCGKAKNDTKISLYYWQPVGNTGKWEEAASNISNSSVIEIQQNFTGDLFVDSDNFINICLVATPKKGEMCSLFTDYIKIDVYGHGSFYYGHLISNKIEPDDLDRWEKLIFEDYKKSGTSIKYHILYENITGDFNLVDNDYLPENQNGFTSSPVSLEDLPRYDTIKILANLSTNNPSISPEIDSLGLIWQTDNNIWIDSFSSSFRIDKIDNVIISNNESKLMLSVNDWLMFGKNSANTRSTDSFGPDITNHSLYWLSTKLSGGEFRNPILDNNVLYIVSIDGDRLYSYNATLPLGDENSIITPLKEVKIPSDIIESSPALTNDNKLIVASGRTSNDGDKDNKIFAFSTENNLSDSPIWNFSYGEIDEENPYICYSASPTIYEDKILITSWSGKDTIWNSFNFSSGNNKLIALDFDGNFKWLYDLPAGSFSSPAVYDDVVIVGCENNDGNSIFAIDVNNGEKIWNSTIGPVGRNSPLIYDDKVFIKVKEQGMMPFTGFEHIIALDFGDGSEHWNLSIGDEIADNYEKICGSSSSVYDDYLYTASADGTIYIIDIKDGTEIKSRKIYTKSIISPYYLVSSPVCSRDNLYIGTPDGILFALDKTNLSIIWQENSYDESPIQNSPIVVDGLIYYSSENGYLTARGKYKTIEDEVITGSIISSPIYLPNPNYNWNKFYAEYITNDGKIEFFILDKYENILLHDISHGSSISNINNKDIIKLRADFSVNYSSNVSGKSILKEWRVTFGDDGDGISETIFYDNRFYSSGDPPICKIDVQNQYVGLLDSAQFRVEYEQQSEENTSQWYNGEFSGNDGTLNRETITADLSEVDITDNDTIYLEIQFKINDAGDDNKETISTWYEIGHYTPDIQPPIFLENTFKPEDGYISKANPICSINVQDEGTKGNISGLNTASGKYKLQYRDSTTSRVTQERKATTTAENGTDQTITLTADLSNLSFIDDIVEFQKITFYIEDMAGNINNSNDYELKTDNEKPSSWIINTDEIPSKTNIKSVKIDAMAEDNISGINYVELYYSKIEGIWIKFGSDDYIPPYTWNFSITETIGGGEFELCTIATDLANNVEDLPQIGDISFIYDPIKPEIESYKSKYIFENDLIPSFDDIQFTDDYKLKNVEYRLEFHDQNKWIQINENNIDTNSYTPSWNLSKDDWDYMVEDIEYYIYFRITDSLDNIYETTSNQDAVKIIKNIQINVIKTPYDPDITDLKSLNWNNIYKIFVNISENEISEIKLLYRYSQNNENWSDWIQYGELKNTSPFEWEFSVDNGSGFYEFKTTVFDPSGKYYESEIQSVNLILFPTYLIIAMVISIIFLLIVTAILFKRLKK
ncbi:PQQ-binding-like beta-propeller repeat protein, partial [Thermoplasmatota archaeon]